MKKTLKQWIAGLLSFSSRKKAVDRIDESSLESFPASDPPAWAGSEPINTATSNQGDSNPVNLLREEHRIIMEVIYLMHEQVEILQRKQAIDTDQLQYIIEFMSQFAEKTHHQKEVDHLLPALERSGAPLAEYPPNTLKQDHELSLGLITTLEKLLPLCDKNDPLISEKLIETLSNLKDIYTRHTLKEENFIFPLVEKYLSSRVKKSLAAQFEKIDKES